MAAGTRGLGIVLLLLALALAGCTTVRLGLPVDGDGILVPVWPPGYTSSGLPGLPHQSTALPENHQCYAEPGQGEHHVAAREAVDVQR